MKGIKKKVKKKAHQPTQGGIEQRNLLIKVCREKQLGPAE
jgi:hypothetical protein